MQRVLALVVVLTVVAAGCSSVGPNDRADTPTIGPAATSTVTPTQTATATASTTVTATATETLTMTELVTVNRTAFGRNTSGDTPYEDGYTLTVWLENANERAVEVTYTQEVAYTDGDDDRSTVVLPSQTVTVSAESTLEHRYTFVYDEQITKPAVRVGIERVKVA